jgi:hypothetical protein
VSADGDPDGPGDASPQDERDDRPELDVDAAFAAIVADFGRPLPAGVGPWPASEDVDVDAPPVPPGATRGGGVGPGATVLPDPAALRPGHTPRHRLPDDVPPLAPESVPPDDPEDRFVPPEAPPIMSTELPSRLAWLGVLGAPLVLLVAALTWSRLPTLMVVAALAAFVGGFVTLVLRLPRDRDDNGPDDGAVV